MQPELTPRPPSIVATRDVLRFEDGDDLVRSRIDDEDLVADIRATGATVRTSSHDPLIELVQAQRLALAVAAQRGLDPDAPRGLSRSIILT